MQVNSTGRLLRPFVTRQWRYLAAAIVSTVVVAAAELARPLPLALVIDRLLDGRRAPFDLSSDDVRLLTIVAALVLGVALADALAQYVADVRLKRAGERIMHDLRAVTYSHLQRLSLSYHERRHAGDLVTRITGDVNAVGTVFSDSLGSIAASVLSLLGMLVVSFFIDPVLAMAAFFVAPILALLTFRFRRRLRTAARRQRKKEGEIASMATEALSAMREVKAFGSEDFEHGRVLQKSRERQEAGIEASQIESRFTGLIDVLGAVGTALVLVVGVLRVASGAVSPGELVVMASYVRRIYRPLRDIAKQSARISSAMARADRVAEVLATDEVLPEPPGAYHGRRAAGEVTFEGVSFAYDPARPALIDLSLHVPVGEKIAILGRSGAGKSTVAALIARFYDPLEGEGRVLIDGRDVRSCSLSWLRGQVGLVLQDTVLFTGTVEDNIAYGLDAGRERVVAAAKAAGAHAFISELPEGYETTLGPRAVGLSGGQRQRIAVARTLLRDPPVLVLDEPTTGLDRQSETQVLEGLGVLMRGRTTVIITHSLDLARTADRVVVVHDGRIAEDGSPEEVLPHDGVQPEETERADLVSSAPIRSVLPPDHALPQMPALLDAGAMAAVLERSLDPAAGRPDVRVRYLRYKPGTNLVVHYDVGMNDGWHGATAMIAAGDSLPRRARKPHNLALARQVDGASPASMPLQFEDDIRALIQWLPLDLSLPALAQAGGLRRTLRDAGLRVRRRGSGPALMRYKPRRRAVLRLDRHVVKIYADETDFDRAVRGLQGAGEIRGISTPAAELVMADQRLTVQAAILGTAAGSPLNTAEEAGQMLAAVHKAELRGLESRSPADQLEAVRSSLGLAAHLVPSVAARVESLLAELESSMPAPDAIVTSHGDFHAGQLLDEGSGPLTVLDFDEICLAPDSLDLATYAAHLVRGGVEDLAMAREALERMVQGYGKRPAGIDWYLATSILRRAPFPFRYLDEHWPDLIEARVEAGASALGQEV